MKKQKNLMIFFLLGFFSGVLLTSIFIKAFINIHEIAIGKTRETAICASYDQCREFYEQNKKSPDSVKSLIEFCKQKYTNGYAYLYFLEDGSIQYRRLNEETWILFALDGGLGYVAAERIKAGGVFRRRLTKVSPKYKIIENDE